jgi:cytochrome c-type biogenesis protein CcmE
MASPARQGMVRRGRKSRRLALIGVAGLALGIAAALVFYALGDRITYAPTPSELVGGSHPPGTRVRLGGLVETGSVTRGADGHVRFAVTDTANRVAVDYVGILPDLFREGQGVVTEGILADDGTLRADTVLAKHDERYMPKEVVDALKAQGRWEEGAMTDAPATHPATTAPAGGAPVADAAPPAGGARAE